MVRDWNEKFKFPDCGSSLILRVVLDSEYKIKQNTNACFSTLVSMVYEKNVYYNDTNIDLYISIQAQQKYMTGHDCAEGAELTPSSMLLSWK